jgi:hypothetical protein
LNLNPNMIKMNDNFMDSEVLRLGQPQSIRIGGCGGMDDQRRTSHYPGHSFDRQGSDTALFAKSLSPISGLRTTSPMGRSAEKLAPQM